MLFLPVLVAFPGKFLKFLPTKYIYSVKAGVYIIDGFVCFRKVLFNDKLTSTFKLLVFYCDLDTLSVLFKFQQQCLHLHRHAHLSLDLQQTPHVCVLRRKRAGGQGQQSGVRADEGHVGAVGERGGAIRTLGLEYSRLLPGSQMQDPLLGGAVVSDVESNPRLHFARQFRRSAFAITSKTIEQIVVSSAVFVVLHATLFTWPCHR